MNFWEKHRNALTTAGLALFMLAVAYLGWVRSANAESQALRGANVKLKKKLEGAYPEIKDPRGIRRPLLVNVDRACERRKQEYEEQLKGLTDRLRFPFVKDFPWAEVPKGPDGKPREIPGVYLAYRYNVVAEDVDKYRVGNPRGSHTKLAEKWLGFKPDDRPNTVKLSKANEELRKLALADRITKLAIDQGVSLVVKVKPQKITREAAYRRVYDRRYKRHVREPYANAFIVNYPVSIEMVGSIDSVMKFFHGLRGERHFLVIRSFKIVSGGGPRAADKHEVMKPEEVRVTISAACMDFKKEDKSKAKEELAPESTYVAPTHPRGH